VRAVTVELDHVIVLVDGPDAAATRLPGCTLDPGRRHTGQGTRNRRVFFDRAFLELLWIDAPEDERRSGLGFAQRLVEPTACPFGVVLRGEVPGADRARFVEYTVPDGSGMTLVLLAAALADRRLPFVAVWETAPAELATRWPAGRVPAELRVHPSGARGVARARLRSALVPAFDGLAPRDVEFAAGPAELRLDVEGVADPWVLR
jgi:hypothetical protein